MMAVLESFLNIIVEQLSKGNLVEFCEFGSLRLRINPEGAATVEEVRASQIATNLPRFNPSKLFKNELAQIDSVKGTLVSQPEA